ncbi:hypothetical protein ACI3DN_12535 [Sellimonas catena]|uniref:Uncharacterized protein n=1 Tax=Sellimonas catena TaxID=2994035 RepID=A0A9W6CE14_9FIRM|nr:hypothetical protein [Sellimonas catena]GLG06151.1 hypothetical protein Selli1_33250 [Sellimonas catena]
MPNYIWALIVAKSVQESKVFISGMNAKDWFTILIPASVTLLGFVITYFSLRKSFKDEIRKQKSNIALEKMSTVPFETLELYETMLAPVKIQKQIDEIEKKKGLSRIDRENITKLNQQKIEAQQSSMDKMTKLLNTIYAYGSVNAIKIVASMQKLNYSLKPDSTDEERWIIMAHMILLSSQVKKDVTNITVNPQKWFEMKITDYETNREIFDPVVNKVVKELGLDEKFKIL